MKRFWLSVVTLVALVAPTRSAHSNSFAIEIRPGPNGAASTIQPIRYRPRGERSWDGGYRSHGFGQIHAGFFDPDGDSPSAFLIGVRAGTSIDSRVQLGFGLDLSHRSDRTGAVVREVPVPGGGTVEQRAILSRFSSNLLPMTAILQFSPAIDAPVQPYFGVGAGYEVLFLSAEDFDTQEKFDATYGGWGWQVWGGAAIPLSGGTRIGAEVVLNNARLERDVDDPTSGRTLREIVPMDGVGMRFGVSWGF